MCRIVSFYLYNEAQYFSKRNIFQMTRKINYLFFSHLLGLRYNPNYFVALPVFCGSLFSPFLPDSILKTESVALLNMYLEFLVKRSHLQLIQKIRKSKISATLIFSFLNIFIMCGMLKTNCPNLWFSKFHYHKTETNTCERIHRNLTCRNFIFKVNVTTLKFNLRRRIRN